MARISHLPSGRNHVSGERRVGRVESDFEEPAELVWLGRDLAGGDIWGRGAETDAVQDYRVAGLDGLCNVAVRQEYRDVVADLICRSREQPRQGAIALKPPNAEADSTPITERIIG